MSSTAERRKHPRVATALRVHCQRLGRSGVDEVVEVIDLSPAGARISAPPELQVGDVVQLTMGQPVPLTVSALVVHVTSAPAGDGYGHVAFTRLVPETEARIAELIDATPAT